MARDAFVAVPGWWGGISDALVALDRKPTCSEWAQSNRVLSRKSSHYDGPWLNERTPYLVGVMDAFSNATTREIVMCKPAQSGGTEAMMNMLGYAIAVDPGPAIWVHPAGEDKLRTLSRIRDLSSDSPAVQELKGEGRWPTTKTCCTWRGMTLWFGSSGAARSLASIPCRYVFADELDKYERWTQIESDPISLVRERMETYRDVSKIVLVSTPTLEGGYIWQSLQQCHQVRFFVPCPECGTYQTLVWSGAGLDYGVRWQCGLEARAEDIVEHDLARYECCSCRTQWDDDARRGAVGRGMWCHAEMPATKEPEPDPINAERMGFQWSRLYSVVGTRLMSRLAAQWVLACQATTMRSQALMAFKNSTLAEPWVEVEKRNEWAALAKRPRDTYMLGEIPSAVQLLTIGVDLHDDNFRYAVRGWGYLEESWLILYGEIQYPYRAPDWAMLASVLLLPRQTEDKRPIYPCLMLIDSGHLPLDVYEFAKFNSHIARATKGDEQGQQPWYGRTHKDLNLVLYHVKPSVFKDYIQAHLSITSRQGAGVWHYPENVGDDYWKEMCAEQKERMRHPKTHVVQYRWTNEHNQPNHYFDCEVLNCVAAEMSSVRALPMVPTAPQKDDGRDARDWRRSWVNPDRGPNDPGKWNLYGYNWKDF